MWFRFLKNRRFQWRISRSKFLGEISFFKIFWWLQSTAEFCQHLGDEIWCPMMTYSLNISESRHAGGVEIWPQIHPSWTVFFTQTHGYVRHVFLVVHITSYHIISSDLYLLYVYMYTTHIVNKIHKMWFAKPKVACHWKWWKNKSYLSFMQINIWLWRYKWVFIQLSYW